MNWLFLIWWMALGFTLFIPSWRYSFLTGCYYLGHFKRALREGWSDTTCSYKYSGDFFMTIVYMRIEDRHGRPVKVIYRKPGITSQQLADDFSIKDEQ